MKGEIFGIFDVAQVTLYLFFIFFIGLMIYIRREDRREGYPLFSEPSNTYKQGDDFFIPEQKTFKLPHGGTSQVPTFKPDQKPIMGEKIALFPGAPLEPIGNPMLAEIGPGSYCERANIPDPTLHGEDKIVPLRVAKEFGIADQDPDPRGMPLVGGDGGRAGTIKDVWVDRSEVVIRYLEAEILPSSSKPARSVLVPMNFVKVNKNKRQVEVDALMSDQFSDVPVLASPNKVTLREEDKICAYYGAGTLYARPSRTEPLL